MQKVRELPSSVLVIILLLALTNFKGLLVLGGIVVGSFLLLVVLGALLVCFGVGLLFGGVLLALISQEVKNFFRPDPVPIFTEVDLIEQTEASLYDEWLAEVNIEYQARQVDLCPAEPEFIEQEVYVMACQKVEPEPAPIEEIPVSPEVQRALELLRAGKSVRAVAKEIGKAESTVRSWRKKYGI